MAAALTQEQGWLGLPPQAQWVPEGDPNPFIRFRHLLWSYWRALDAGWSDERYVDLVRDVDERLAQTSGVRFTVTPYDTETQLSQAVAADVGASVTISVKDETGQVGGSHKARHLMGMALHLAVDEERFGRTDRLAISSCGNAALGAATVAAALDRPLDVYVPDWADPVVLELIATLGGELQVCTRRDGQLGDPCMEAFTSAVESGAAPFSVQGTVNPWAIDGGRLLGWELAQAIEDGLQSPDRLLIQVGGGALASSAVQGLMEARDMEIIEALPRLYPVQTVGCAPLDRALRRVAESSGGLADAALSPDDFMTPWEDEPSSAATGILDDVTYDWLGIALGVQESGGRPIVVNETHVARAHQLAHQHTDIDVCITGTSGLAGVLALDDLRDDEHLAVLFTGVER